MEFRLSARSEHAKAWAAHRKAGMIIPGIGQEPTVLPPFQWIWNAWVILNDLRLRYEHPQRIQLGAIKDLCDLQGITDVTHRELLAAVILHLDRIFITDYWNKVAKDLAREKLRRR